MKSLAAIIVAVLAVCVSAQDPTTAKPNVTTAAAATTVAVTTVAAPTTEAPPITTGAPPTQPQQTTWKVLDGANKTCVLAQMTADITVSYNKTDGTQMIVTMPLPQTAAVDAASSCGNGSTTPAVLLLSFDTKNYVKQVFTLDVNNTYSLTELTIGLFHDAVHFPNSTQKDTLVNYTGTPVDVFEAKNDKSFRCNSMQSVNLQGGGNTTYTDVKVQPFGVSGDAFSEESVCAADASTTPAPSPTPTLKPTPKPEEPAGNWTVNTTDGKTCMNMTFRASFSIDYWTTDDKLATLALDLPDNATATTSTCNDTMANFVLTFFESWTMGMMFTRELSANANNNGSFSLDSYNLTYMYDTHFNKPEKKGKLEVVSNTKAVIDSDVGKYYKCNSNTKIVAANSTTILSDMALQPFAQFTTNGTKGDSYTECAADSAISNIVPIAVGCALAGLVIIVLIAYLIGRSRSSRQGYQSV